MEKKDKTLSVDNMLDEIFYGKETPKQKTDRQRLQKSGDYNLSLSPPLKSHGTNPDPMRPGPTKNQPPASWWTRFKTGLVESPQYKTKIYADDRGIPEENYRTDQYGDLVFQGPDGLWYKETQPGLWNYLKNSTTDMAADLPAELGADFGMKKMGLPGAFFGGAMGDYARNVAGNLIFGEPFDLKADAANATLAGTEALIGAQGTKWGLGAFDYIRNRGAGRAARDAARSMSEQIDPRRISQLSRTARQHGITPLPAVISASPSLGNKVQRLGAIDTTAAIIENAQSKLNQESLNAIQVLLNKLAPEQDALEAGEEVAASAAKRIGGMDEARSAAVSPVYKSAFENAEPVNVKPIVDMIDQKLAALPEQSSIGRQLKKIRMKLFVQGKTKQGVPISLPQDNMEALNVVKMELDDLADLTHPAAINEAPSLRRHVKKHALDVRNELLRVMDEASPEYATARAKYASMSPAIDRVKKSSVGNVARLAGQGDATVGAVRALFNGKNVTPKTVSNARLMFPPDIWKKAVRVHFQDALSRVKDKSWNAGYKFWSKAWSGPERDLMRAALEDNGIDGINLFQGVDDFFNLLEQTGKMFYGGSRTQMNQANEALMNRAGLARRATQAAGRPMEALGLLLTDRIDELATDEGRRRLAIALTSEEAAAELKFIKKLSPVKAKKYEAFGAFLGVVLGNSDRPSKLNTYMQEMLRQEGSQSANSVEQP